MLASSELEFSTFYLQLWFPIGPDAWPINGWITTLILSGSVMIASPTSLGYELLPNLGDRRDQAAAV
jgi:hypothetical protein